MSPWSDIRSHAEALSASNLYVTFVDVVPILRLAQTMVHLPDATLVALAQLHDGPGTTDGARALLQQLAHGYHTRVRQQRALGRRLVTSGDRGRSIRIAVGAGFVVALPLADGGPWTWAVLEAAAAAAPVAVEVAASPRRNVQRFAVHGLAPGTCALQASQAEPTRRQLTYRVIVDPAPP